MKDFSYITIPEAWFLQLHHALNANPLNPTVFERRAVAA